MLPKMKKTAKPARNAIIAGLVRSKKTSSVKGLVLLALTKIALTKVFAK